MTEQKIVDILKTPMDREGKIVALCQVISHWASQRGQAMIWQKQDEFEKYNKYTKKFIGDLEKFIKDDSTGSEGKV